MQQLWQALESGATLESLLGTVVSGCGANLSAMPQFGIVSTAGGIHAVLRGDVVVSADADGQELSGHGVSSWTEGRLASDRVTIVAGSGGTERQASRDRGCRCAPAPCSWESFGWARLPPGRRRLQGTGCFCRPGCRRPRCRSTGAADRYAPPAPAFAGSGCPRIWTMTGIYVPEDEPDGAAAAADPASAGEEPAGGQTEPDAEAAVDDDLDQTDCPCRRATGQFAHAPQQQSADAVRGSAAVASDVPAGRTGSGSRPSRRT